MRDVILFRLLGSLLLVSWLFIFFHHVFWSYWGYLLWLSNIVLLFSGIALLMRNNFFISGSFLAVFLMHLLWIIDFLVLLFINSAPLGFTAYLRDLATWDVFMTSHHFFLLPVLGFALYRQKVFYKKAWLLAGLLFLLASFSSFFLTGSNYNINCSHGSCGVLEDSFGLIQDLYDFNSFLYLIFINLGMTFLNYYPLNMLFLFISKRLTAKKLVRK